jgi:hypothetical protein
MNLTPMDYVRGALCNAMAENMTVEDLYRMAEYAETCERWDNAVNELTQASPDYLCDTPEFVLAIMYPTK